MLILIVEDQPLHAKLFAEFVRHLGHTSIVAPCCSEAFAVAAAVRPDLIVMDVLLPDGDGRDAIRQLRADSFGDVPIIALSALPDREMMATCLVAGADGFIGKPVSFRAFGQEVAAVSARYA